MMSKIKNWIRDMINFSMDTGDCANEINAEIAKSNYQKGREKIEREHKQKRERYIKALCNEINIDSQMGIGSVLTRMVFDSEYMTPDFMGEIREYFEQRGFKVEKEYGYPNDKVYWLRISWD